MVKAMAAALRLVLNLSLAVLLVFVACVVLFSGFASVYLPMWETEPLGQGTDEGEWLWVDDQAIHYTTWGARQDRPVVLIHGDMIEGSLSWGRVPSLLADAGTHVVAVDLLGYGRSSRVAEPVYSQRIQTRMLAHVLNEYGIQDATVVAHGRGAATALQLAVEQPQFIERIVLVSPCLADGEPLAWRTVAGIPYVGQAAAWALRSGGPLWKSLRTGMVASTEAFPERYWRIAEVLGRIRGSAEAARMRVLSLPDDNLPEAIPGISVPVSVLLGDQDRTLSQREAEALASQFIDASVQMLPGAGHLAQIDQPAAVVEAIAGSPGTDASLLP